MARAVLARCGIAPATHSNLVTVVALLVTSVFLGCLDRDDHCEQQEWYLDEDRDGYGTELTSLLACEQPPRYSASASDCDDADVSVHPGAIERCDEVDNDCDGEVDEDVEPAWYLDADGDGYGNPAAVAYACEQPDGYVQNASDCDDAGAAVYPGATELICDNVDSDCNGIGGLLEVSLNAEEFADLQTAIDAAVDGDEILVCPGTYKTQAIVPADRELTIRSWSGDPADTILDGALSGRVLTVEDGVRLTLANLGLSRGVGQNWVGGLAAGALLSRADVLRVEGCRFEDNSAEDYGGAVLVTSEDHAVEAVFHGCTFLENWSSGPSGDGGALAIVGQHSMQVSIEDSTFEGNTSETGGAIRTSHQGFLSPILLDIVGTTFSGNTASDWLGPTAGAAVFAHGTSLTMERCAVTGNVADETDGVVAFEPGIWDVELTVLDCEFEGNEGLSIGTGGAQGGGFTVRIERSTFTDNTTPGVGTVSISASSATADVQILECSFYSNHSDLVGGALELTAREHITADIAECTFTDNSALEEAGAVTLYALTDGLLEVTLRDSVLDGNIAGDGGGAMDVSAQLAGTIRLTVMSTTFQGNSALEGGAISTSSMAGATIEIELIESTIVGHTGGGVLLGEDAEFVSIGSEWGTGGTENLPYDVDTGGFWYLDYGSGEDFSCTGGYGCAD